MTMVTNNITITIIITIMIIVMYVITKDHDNRKYNQLI